MKNKVHTNHDVIRWAVQRSGRSIEKLRQRFDKIDGWLDGSEYPSLSQLKSFAKLTATPLGYLFLASPPSEKLPVTDFRTLDDARVRRPSAALLNTIYEQQQRQSWMREYLISIGEDKLPFVGATSINSTIEIAARNMQSLLQLTDGWAANHSTWKDALKTFVESIENVGVLVSTSSYLGTKTNWALSVDEFRGFVLNDEYAPLIFVNGADSKSARMFTLAHEFVHVMIGQSGVFDLPFTQSGDDEVEKFANQVAAEFLVPAERLIKDWDRSFSAGDQLRKLASIYKVSPVVMARRALDLKLIPSRAFREFYKKVRAEWELDKAKRKEKGGGGGDYYRDQASRLGNRFSQALVSSTREGRTLFNDAYRLSGMRGSTFHKYADFLQNRESRG